jgi:mannose-6-phosphate isomerase-like protein (cupin superfamily)
VGWRASKLWPCGVRHQHDHHSLGHDDHHETPMPEKFHLDEKFARFSEHWRPKVVAALNGQEIKVVKVAGTFPWHQHENEDEFFLVWKGRFRVEFRDQVVELGPGECLVVPRGIEHRTAADEETEIVLFEPVATRNTGNVVDAAFTAPDGASV